MSTIRVLALLLLMAPMSSSFSDTLTDCLDHSLNEGEVQGDAYCYAEESERLDKKVEVLFSEKLRQLGNLPKALAVSRELQMKARQNFTDAQAHWAAYKEAACRFEGDATLGTRRPRVYSACIIELDKRRIGDLEATGF